MKNASIELTKDLIRCRECKHSSHDIKNEYVWCRERLKEPDGFCDEGERNE